LLSRKDFAISKDRYAARTDGSGGISKGQVGKEKTVSRAGHVSPTNGKNSQKSTAPSKFETHKVVRGLIYEIYQVGAGSAEVFSCDFKCGFEGGFERVSAHESTCRFNPAAATSAGYVAGAPGSPHNSGRLPAQLTGKTKNDVSRVHVCEPVCFSD
jgi:hypothetical protein